MVHKGLAHSRRAQMQPPGDPCTLECRRTFAARWFHRFDQTLACPPPWATGTHCRRPRYSPRMVVSVGWNLASSSDRGRFGGKRQLGSQSQRLWSGNQVLSTPQGLRLQQRPTLNTELSINHHPFIRPAGRCNASDAARDLASEDNRNRFLGFGLTSVRLGS
jgi:hypothetical protein